METDFLKMHHLKCYEGVIDKERVTPNDRQIRKQTTYGSQSAYPRNTHKINARLKCANNHRPHLLMKEHFFNTQNTQKNENL